MRRGDEAGTVSLVSPEPARSLQEHVGGRQLGDEQIGIKVHALLDNLGGNEDRRAPRRPVLAKSFHPLVFEFLATPEGKPRMQKAKTESLACHGPKPLILLLREPTVLQIQRTQPPFSASATASLTALSLVSKTTSTSRGGGGAAGTGRERLVLPSSRDERIGKILLGVFFVPRTDDLAPPLSRERCRKDDDRAAKPFEGGDQLVDERARIECRRSEPRRESRLFPPGRSDARKSVSRRQHREAPGQPSPRRTAQATPASPMRTSRVRCEHHSAASCFPLAAGEKPSSRSKQPGIAVDDPARQRSRRNAPHELRHAPVHAVAGRLSRQGEIDAPRFLVRQELIRRAQRGFGLSRAHRAFNHINAGRGNRGNRPQLHFVGGELNIRSLVVMEQVMERQPRHDLGSDKTNRGDSPLGNRCRIRFHNSTLGREEVLIRANPVGYGRQASQPPQSRGLIICHQSRQVSAKGLANGAGGSRCVPYPNQCRRVARKSVCRV